MKCVRWSHEEEMIFFCIFFSLFFYFLFLLELELKCGWVRRQSCAVVQIQLAK